MADDQDIKIVCFGKQEQEEHAKAETAAASANACLFCEDSNIEGVTVTLDPTPVTQTAVQSSETNDDSSEDGFSLLHGMNNGKTYLCIKEVPKDASGNPVYAGYVKEAYFKASGPPIPRTNWIVDNSSLEVVADLTGQM